MESEKDKYHEQLIAAEKRIDRLQSKTVAALNPHSAGVKEEVKDESPRDTPSSPVHSQSLANGVHSDEANEWESVAKVREGKIEELINENASMRQELFDLKLSMKYPPEELVKDNMHYKVLLIHASKLEHIISENQSEISGLKDEVESLKATRLELEEGVKAATEKATQEVRSMLVKRDNENARLREQRDQQVSELNERKQKDSYKLTSVNEIKALAESRSERIKILESEVKRLRTRLAAEANDEDLMTFLFKSTSEEVSYISDLKSRLAAADRRANASGNTPLTVIEAQAQLAEAHRRLEEYQIIFGKTPLDVSTLTEQLRLKESEIEKLRLLEKQRDQAEASLYTELEKLSAAWEALDRQVKGKVFDLAAMEERISKSSLEKAKSDNKFYSAMRDKEAIETERKNLARTLEKQGKLLERLSEGEKTLIARTSDLEREVKAWRQAVDKQKECSETLEKEVQQWQKRATGERERCDKLIYAIREHEDDLRKRREELRKAEEAVAKSKKEADKYAAKMKAMSHNHSSSANSREHDLQSEVDKCMTILKCSTCKMHMRNTVITKCMHCKADHESHVNFLDSFAWFSSSVLP
ncbi:hypothetical protein PHLCEN_2v6513 [Hermanssonia centrifuga]|uniref:E3 ubiquitin protein ligase n=1 Tax=Hermanssonia centrifuga TaxID=98765 RepID=A0A2R6NZC8_9APHY|nr:hypothetical protein PHLCEN_2v6513 [Hermanssonia centrifuga]